MQACVSKTHMDKEETAKFNQGHTETGHVNDILLVPGDWKKNRNSIS